jgi:hypothetical protein
MKCVSNEVPDIASEGKLRTSAAFSTSVLRSLPSFAQLYKTRPRLPYFARNGGAIDCFFGADGC